MERTPLSQSRYLPDALGARVTRFAAQLAQLLGSPAIPFDEKCRSSLPESQGVYRIFDPAFESETVRAGRTRSAAGGLRQRVYQNHLMGSQAGNLRAQLVADSTVEDTEAAKSYIRRKLVAQVLIVEDDTERARLEYFMLAVLNPRYCD